METKRNLKVDALVFLLLIVSTMFYPLITKGTAWCNILSWSFVITIPVVIYLGIRKKKNWNKIFAGAFVFGLLFGFILEFIANITSVWQEPTIFSFRVLGITSFESILFYPIMTIFILVFYEHFFDRDVTKRISSNIWQAIIPAIIVIIFLITGYIYYSSLFYLPYTYMILGGLAIIIPVFHCIKRPILFKKYAMLAVCLFLFLLVVEVIGVTFGYWYFPGTQYIGTVTVFSQKFPLEEIIFWMFFYPATITSYYENFIDDMK